MGANDRRAKVVRYRMGAVCLRKTTIATENNGTTGNGDDER
jgi:hypothetical protein